MVVNKLVKHVYMVPDGNRTYAKKYNVSLQEAYKRASKVAWDSVSWILLDNDADIYSFYGLSLKNLMHRKVEELKPIIYNETEYALKVAEDPLFHDNEIRFTPVGNSNFFRAYETRPELQEILCKYQDALAHAELATRNYEKRAFNLLVGYSWVHNMCELKTPVDLRIRTANQGHMSDEPFEVLEGAFWYYEPKLFPELEKSDIDRAIRKAEEELEYFEFPETVMSVPQFILGSLEATWARG